jgi:ribosomal-protein-alanine N-acetyltransferase
MTAPAIAIQPISLSSAPALAGLHAESFGAACWSVDAMRGSLMLKTTQGWMALADDQPAGFILCQVTADEAEIMTLCVRPTYRRQGIGEQLVRHVLTQLPPSTALHLEVAADNNAARRLYERCGFAITRTRPAYYKREDGLVDGISYCLSGSRT